MNKKGKALSKNAHVRSDEENEDKDEENEEDCIEVEFIGDDEASVIYL